MLIFVYDQLRGVFFIVVARCSGCTLDTQPGDPFCQHTCDQEAEFFSLETTGLHPQQGGWVKILLRLLTWK